MSFYKFVQDTKNRPKEHKPLLSIDPGETCGWSYFKDYELSEVGEIKIDTQDNTMLDGSPLWRLFETHSPALVIVEGYRIYPHMTKQHTWNALYTPKLIGYIEAICQHYGIKYTIQLASSKQFCTNEKLKQWELYYAGRKHANDAIRHACYYLLFNKGE